MSLAGDARMAYAVERMKDIRRQVLDERLARTAASEPAFVRLRRTVGRWLVELGTSIAGSVDASRMRVDAGRGEEPWMV